jgi:hypothetical protein
MCNSRWGFWDDEACVAPAGGGGGFLLPTHHGSGLGHCHRLGTVADSGSEEGMSVTKEKRGEGGKLGVLT